MTTTHDTLAHARTLLFVPGNRPERFAKALSSGADAVVLDLEDSVPAGEKPAARIAVAEALASLAVGVVPVVVRLNSMATPAGREDIAALASVGPAALMVSKAETVDELQRVRALMPRAALLPLIESARGLDALAGLAAVPQVLRLALGHIDFMADTGILCSGPDERELDPLRFAVAMRTRLARLHPAIDGVTVSIDDAARLAADTRRALHFGFGGKLCIHPRQVAAIHVAMAPDAQQLQWANRVVEADAAAGGAAVQLDGRMVDLPVVLQARRTLARAAHAG